MLALVQRVTRACVRVDNAVVGEIGAGLLVLLCAEQGDTSTQADKMLDKLLKLRIFSDKAGKMNHSVCDMDGAGQVGGLLIVSQFTLAAQTRSGHRPGFSQAAPPALGQQLYDYFVQQAQAKHPKVACGIFAADMQVELVNDGPVTIPLSIPASVPDQ